MNAANRNKRKCSLAYSVLDAIEQFRLLRSSFVSKGKCISEKITDFIISMKFHFNFCLLIVRRFIRKIYSFSVKAIGGERMIK